jgi:hypothetical protein
MVMMQISRGPGLAVDRRLRIRNVSQKMTLQRGVNGDGSHITVMLRRIVWARDVGAAAWARCFACDDTWISPFHNSPIQ